MDHQHKPRPKTPTLLGVAPPSYPPVVGAVARPSARPSEITQRMIFAPTSEAELPAASRRDSREEAGIDDEWPDEPPSAVPVQLATVPPPPLVPNMTPATKSPGVRRARRSTRWVALAALTVLLGGVIGLRVHRSGVYSAARVNPPTEMLEVAATATPTATTQPSSSSPVSAASPAAESAPLAGSPPEVESPPVTSPTFDAAAAKQALEATASAVARCHKGGVSGAGFAIVTFGSDGAVRRSAVSPPYLGTPAGMCVARALGQARVPEFAGKPTGVVVHNFVVPAQ